MTLISEVYNEDCRETMKRMPDNYLDSIVTDPPYELGFMGKHWDSSGIAYNVDLWREAYRVLKPGGHLLAFGGSRTYHRLACAIEDAGFEIRDQIQWIYGSGFPKSLDVGKAVDKVNGEMGRLLKFVEWMRTTGLTAGQINAAIEKADVGSHYLRRDQPAIPTRQLWVKLRPLCGDVPAWVDELIKRIEAEREVVGWDTKARSTSGKSALPTMGGETVYESWDITAPATEAAKRWNGYGTALKPAFESICVAQKRFQHGSDFDILFVSLLKHLKYQLCQHQLFAQIAERNLRSSRQEQSVGLNIAQWLAGENISTREDLYVLMVTLQSVSKEYTNWNTVLSWLNILADLYTLKNTYTTSTELNMTTELSILNSLEWGSIFQNIIHHQNSQTDGSNVSVYIAESILNAVGLKLKDIHTRFVQEGAISKEYGLNFAPNNEPIVVARKPLDGTVAQNVLKWGCGGLNIAGCRVEGAKGGGVWGSSNETCKPTFCDSDTVHEYKSSQHPAGRFPANVIHDGSEEVVSKFPNTKSGKAELGTGTIDCQNNGIYGSGKGGIITSCFADSGSAARFFYCAKASKAERDKGLDGFELGEPPASARSKAAEGRQSALGSPRANHHPTVKPISLMRYLCRLVTPPNGLIYDPFTGSGTTGIAAKMEGFNFIGSEQEAEYAEIAQARIAAWEPEVDKQLKLL